MHKAIRPAPPEVDPEVFADDFPVVGVFRKPTDEEQKESWSQFPADSDLILPYRTAVDLFFRDPARREQGVDQAVLLVDDMRTSRTSSSRSRSWASRAGRRRVHRARATDLSPDLRRHDLRGRGGLARLVPGDRQHDADERPRAAREIGIMKAVGADNWQLLFIFVVEGGLIGLVGGAIGLLLAWAASFPGDAWVRSMVQRDMKIDLKGSIFVFPAWIAVTVVLFTVLVTTVAALYPARHAARVDPVKALRHDLRAYPSRVECPPGRALTVGHAHA